MPDPEQYTTFDGSLDGVVDGVNNSFTFHPHPRELLYSASAVTGGILVFRNGVLQDDPEDYDSSPGMLSMAFSAVPDTVTARFYSQRWPSKIRLTASGFSVRMTAYQGADVMLFRNGQLLTPGADYTVSGLWAVLTQAVQPGDIFSSVAGIGGAACSTYAGTITGVVDGVNATFGLPSGSVDAMLFRNGDLLTIGLDYTLSGSTVTILAGQIPITGDTLTAQAFTSGGPGQMTTADGTLSYSVASRVMVFYNGLLMTHPYNAGVSGDTVNMSAEDTPAGTDTLTVKAWVPGDIPGNLPTQVTTVNGGISGTIDGSNRTFSIPGTALVTGIILAWNGDVQAEGLDYTWQCAWDSGVWATRIQFISAKIPAENDFLTAEVFYS